MGVELIFAVVFSLGFFSGYNAGSGEADRPQIESAQLIDQESNYSMALKLPTSPK